MIFPEMLQAFNSVAAGLEMHGLMRELFPLPRSITGNGVRQTLKIIQRQIPLNIHEIPSGTAVLDWTVPQEWNVHEAWIKDSQGRTLVDFALSNLHLVGYSRPIHVKLSLRELQPHLFSLPDHPDWIPYRTAYYRDTWGFCLPHRLLASLTEASYEVCIKATLEDGLLTYGELCLPGRLRDEVLISCHICHPALCNDNLSGLVVAASLAQRLAAVAHRYSYRFLFIPGTIGSITWLAQNEAQVGHIKHGLVLAGVGDAGAPTYKRSRRGNAAIDRAMAHVLKQRAQPCTLMDFEPYGYDERQYGSPGFNLPVGCLMRSPYGGYPEYHTSADNMNFVKPESLADSWRIAAAALAVLEGDRRYVNLHPKGEPQLGRRGLYDALGGATHREENQRAMRWVLNLSDGQHSLLDITERAALDFEAIRLAAETLQQHGLLLEMEDG